MSTLSITKNTFEASNVVLSRATTSTECKEDDTVTPNGKVLLKRVESRSLIEFLVEQAVFTEEDQAISADQKSKLIPLAPVKLGKFAELSALSTRKLNAYVKFLFETDPPSATTSYLVTFVEVKDVKKATLQSELSKTPSRAPKFTFEIRQVVVIRSPKSEHHDVDGAIDGDQYISPPPSFTYVVRDRSPVIYTHSYVGGQNGRPQLDMHCDRAAFVQAPEARFMFELKSRRHKASSQIREILEFVLFPARELRRVMSGETFLWADHMRATTGGAPSTRPKFALDENLFYRGKQLGTYLTFNKASLRLSSTNQSDFLDRLKIASISFAFHVRRSDSCVDQLLADNGLTRDSDAASIDQATNDGMRRIVAAQHATFESRVYHGSETSGFKHSVLTTAKMKRATNGWTARSEWALDAYLASSENQSIEGITLTSKTERNTFYTINFTTHDRTSVLRSLKNSPEYESIREQVMSEGGHGLSVEDQASQMANTLTITVTVHPRVLGHDMGIHSGSKLRDYILTTYGGDVEEFAKRLIKASFDKSGVTYWNGKRHWKLALAEKDYFDAAVEKFCRLKNIKGDSAVIDDARWGFMSSLPYAIYRDDDDTLSALRSLAKKIGKINRADRDFASGQQLPVKGITHIPEFSIALLCFWFNHESAVSWDTIKNTDLLPQAYKIAFFTDRAAEKDAESGKQTLQGVVGTLLADCKRFVLDNFGVNIDHPRDLHKEVWRHRAGALYGKRSRIFKGSIGLMRAEMDARKAAGLPPPSFLDNLPHHLARDQTTSFLQEFASGRMFGQDKSQP